MVVIGCGAVGLNASRVRLAWAERIIAVDVAPRKLDWAREFVATDTVDASEQNPVEAVLALTDGEGVDFVYEVVGRPQTVEQAVKMLDHAGTATLIGVPKPETTATFDLASELFDKRATIRVSHGGDPLQRRTFALLARLRSRASSTSAGW